jgi:hypothetical protein
MMSIAALKKQTLEVIQAALKQLESKECPSEHREWARERYEWWAEKEQLVLNAIDNPQPANVPISPLDWEGRALREYVLEQQAEWTELLGFFRAESAVDGARLRWLQGTGSASPQSKEDDPTTKELREALQDEHGHPTVSFPAVRKALKVKERRVTELIDQGARKKRGRMVTTESLKAYLKANP